jgi:N-acetylneuraminate synthase
MRKVTLKPYLIGEVGLSHGGDIVRAIETMMMAESALCDAVKFQIRTLDPGDHDPNEKWRDPHCDHAGFESRWQYLERTAFTKEQWIRLREWAECNGLDFGASLWNRDIVTWVNGWLGPDFWKIAAPQSWEIGAGKKALSEFLPVHTGKPVFATINEHMSTTEVTHLVKELQGYDLDFTLLVSTADYPTLPESVGLNRMNWLRRAFDCPVGLSDHTGNPWAACIATYLGAKVIEAHIGEADVSPDRFVSLDLVELGNYAWGVDYAWTMKNHPVNPLEIDQ